MRHTRRWWMGTWVVAGVLLTGAAAQDLEAQQVISLSRGASTVVAIAGQIQRVSIGDPNVADANPISTREVLVTGKSVGTTSLIVWDVSDNRRVYTVEVGVDGPGVERQIAALFPGEQVRVGASGNTVILTGDVSSGISARRIVGFVQSLGATVIDQLNAPPSAQVLLRVRIAEISRSAARNTGAEFFGANLEELGPLSETDWSIENTLGELTRILLLDGEAELEVIFADLKARGLLQILAEPELLALDGTEASFLAGGEFPYPVAQTTGNTATYTVTFKEFGVRLRFTPNITAGGTVRLAVNPEVSQLDFGNAVSISGFVMPALRTRRASTSVELRPGQTLAIAGLLDNSLARNVEKVPLLGDIPILGRLFRSDSYRQGRTELVVMVTPTLVTPSDQPLPIPTGEPERWQWEPSLRGRRISPPAAPR